MCNFLTWLSTCRTSVQFSGGYPPKDKMLSHYHTEQPPSYLHTSTQMFYGVLPWRPDELSLYPLHVGKSFCSKRGPIRAR